MGEREPNLQIPITKSDKTDYWDETRWLVMGLTTPRFDENGNRVKVTIDTLLTERYGKKSDISSFQSIPQFSNLRFKARSKLRKFAEILLSSKNYNNEDVLQAKSLFEDIEKQNIEEEFEIGNIYKILGVEPKKRHVKAADASDGIESRSRLKVAEKPIYTPPATQEPIDMPTFLAHITQPPQQSEFLGESIPSALVLRFDSPSHDIYTVVNKKDRR